MKRTIVILLTLSLLLAGCGAKQTQPAETTAATAAAETPTEASTQPPETTTPETTAPKTTPVKVMAEGIPVVRFLLARGDTAQVTGYEGDYALLTAKEGSGLVAKGFLRFPDEAFESWTGYARWNAGLYETAACLGEPLQNLSTNTKVEVLEELDGCYLVRLGEETGFMLKEQLGKAPYVAQPDSGTDSGSAGSSGGYSGPQDGGDITLTAAGQGFTLTLLSDTVKTGDVTVKVDGVPVILRFCALGETVEVLEPGTAPELPGYTAILETDGSFAYIPTDWLETAREFTPWEGYAGTNCKLYSGESLSGKEEKTLYTNKKLTVLWDTGLVAFVQVDGEYFFARTSTLRDTPVVTTPATEPPASGGGSAPAGSTDLWTPPKL